MPPRLRQWAPPVCDGTSTSPVGGPRGQTWARAASACVAVRAGELEAMERKVAEIGALNKKKFDLLTHLRLARLHYKHLSMDAGGDACSLADARPMRAATPAAAGARRTSDWLRMGLLAPGGLAARRALLQRSLPAAVAPTVPVVSFARAGRDDKAAPTVSGHISDIPAASFLNAKCLVAYRSPRPQLAVPSVERARRPAPPQGPRSPVAYFDATADRQPPRKFDSCAAFRGPGAYDVPAETPAPGAAPSFLTMLSRAEVAGPDDRRTRALPGPGAYRPRFDAVAPRLVRNLVTFHADPTSGASELEAQRARDLPAPNRYDVAPGLRAVSKRAPAHGFGVLPRVTSPEDAQPESVRQMLCVELAPRAESR